MGGFWVKGCLITPNLCKRITLGAGDMSYSVDWADVALGDLYPVAASCDAKGRYLPAITEWMTFRPKPMNNVPKTAEIKDLKLI